MEENKVATIPLIVYEKERDRQERKDRRNHWLLILLIVLFFVSNIAWLCVFNSYEKVDYSQDGEGINSINMGEQGDLDYESINDNSQEEETQD